MMSHIRIEPNRVIQCSKMPTCDHTLLKPVGEEDLYHQVTPTKHLKALISRRIHPVRVGLALIGSIDLMD